MLQEMKLRRADDLAGSRLLLAAKSFREKEEEERENFPINRPLNMKESSVRIDKLLIS